MITNRLRFFYNGINFIDITTPLNKKYLEVTGTTYKWVSESMGPIPEGGLNNLYKLPYVLHPDKTWQEVDILAKFDTTNVPNGLCTIRVIGYYWNGITHTIPSNLNINPAYGTISIRIDNTLPQYEILGVYLTNIKVSPCDVIDFGTGINDKLKVEFKAWDLNGHLGWYALNLMYGHNCYVNPPPTTPNKAVDNYASHIDLTQKWHGSTIYSTEYIGSNYGPSSYTSCLPNLMPSCAYQIRLNVTKRTDNGYGLIYHSYEDTWHITIKRP